MEKKVAEQRRYQHTPKDAALMTVEGICFITQIVLCILFFNTLGQHWLMYLGWAVLTAALVLGWRARVAFQTKGEIKSKRDWLNTTVVVDSGVFALVRHPIYLSFFLMSLALVLLSQHWLNLLTGIIVMALIYNDMRREEKNNIEKFGDDYLRYMEKVPRINLVLGLIRLLCCRRANPPFLTNHRK